MGDFVNTPDIHEYRFTLVYPTITWQFCHISDLCNYLNTDHTHHSTHTDHTRCQLYCLSIMVEAPRIRITYDTIKIIKNKLIIRASGPSYKKTGINLVGYMVKNLWHSGKYIYIYVKNKNHDYVIRTHMMMYGRIILNNSVTFPKLTPFMTLDLTKNLTLTWYLSQIKIIDPKCTISTIKTNYSECTFEKSITDSVKLMKYDVSNMAYNRSLHLAHIITGAAKYAANIFVDFLLDQEYFPGVGNILQQEALYRCRILPTNIVGMTPKLNIVLSCLIDQLHTISDLMYKSYMAKQNNSPNTQIESPPRPIMEIYHKAYCPLGHKTVTKYVGFRNRRTTWCPICQK